MPLLVLKGNIVGVFQNPLLSGDAKPIDKMKGRSAVEPHIRNLHECGVIGIIIDIFAQRVFLLTGAILYALFTRVWPN